MSRRKNRSSSQGSDTSEQQSSQSQPSQPSPQGQSSPQSSGTATPPRPQAGPGGSTNPANGGGQGSAPAVRNEAETGLARFEDRFRLLGDQATAAIREQADAFDSVIQTATNAIAQRTKLTAEKSSLQSVVQKLTEERTTLRESLEGVERDCTHLRTQKEKAENERDSFRGSAAKLAEQLSAAQSVNDELRSANSAFEQDLAKAVAANERLEAVTTELTTANRALEKTSKDLAEQLSASKSRCVEFENRAGAAEHANTELLAERKGLKDQITEAVTNCGTLNARIESLEGSNRDLQKTKLDLEQKVASHQARINELQGHLDVAEGEKDEVRSANTRLHSQIASLESDCQSLREQAQAAEEEQQKLQDTRQTLETCLADLSAKAAGLGSDRKEPEIRRATEKEMVELRNRIAELESAESQVSQLKLRISELESALSEAASSSGAGGPSEDLLRELATHADCARELLDALQQPKLDADRIKKLVKSASELALQLDMLNVTAELNSPDVLIELTTEPVDLSTLIQTTLEALASSVSRKGLGLTNRVDPAVPARINADRIRLQQLIVWSTMFMTRHAHEGDIAVSVAAETDPEGNRLLHFQMFNDGIGVAPETLEALVGNSAAGRLSFGREVEQFARIAEAMGGRLRVEPAGKVGFAVRLEIALKTVETTKSGGSNRRDSDRILQELLQCNLGPVVDLSTTGMRIVSQKNLRGKVVVELGDTLPPLKLRAHVVWTNKVDRKQFEVGLRFTNIRPADAEQLLRVARKHGLAAAG